MEETRPIIEHALISFLANSIGNAKTAGMAEDLGMDSNQYSLALTVFFIFYVVCEVPSK